MTHYVSPGASLFVWDSAMLIFLKIISEKISLKQVIYLIPRDNDTIECGHLTSSEHQQYPSVSPS